MEATALPRTLSALHAPAGLSPSHQTLFAHRPIGRRLFQLMSGIGEFNLSLLLLCEHVLCLGARFEELCAQTLDELVVVI
jgi:hypothetical protein